MTLHTALLQGVKLLEESGIPVARLTAEVLLSHAIGRDRVYLYAHPEEVLTELGWIHYGRYLHERMEGKPTQYITKRQEFYGREFVVGPDVLIPRPETEHLVEAALARVRAGDLVLDVGTGSGAIAVSLALESAGRVLASDVSLAALKVASGNAARLGAPVSFVAGDLAACFAAASIDVLVSNPPYVPQKDAEGLQREVREYEPHVALFGGPNGIEIYERLIADAARVVKRGGWLLMELGYNSLETVQRMLAADWSDVDVKFDLAGWPRVVEGRYHGGFRI